MEDSTKENKESDVNAVLKKLQEKLAESHTERLKIGDIVQVIRSGTRGKILKFVDDMVVFRTFDRPDGWCEHTARKEYIEPSKPHKKSGASKTFAKFLIKNNRKPFMLATDFIFTQNGQEQIIKENELVFIDESPKFITSLSVKDLDGFSSDNFHVRFGEETMFSIVKCFIPERSMFLYIPLVKLTPFKWNSDIFKKLSIPDKERLYTFLHENPDLSKLGIEFHKGQGKSILLHGKIGSGKTMTAEALSHILQKPLIRLDIEERNSLYTIHQAFDQAERYDGIVFVDEADMLIADRSSPQARIEAIQVLLKYLELFPGIVIFATNYGAKIDPALDNRIDMKIHYEITDDIRKEIWLKTLPRKLKGKFNIDKYKKYDLNGRDIQKIVTFAGRKAAQRHLLTVPITFIEEEIEARLKEKTSSNGQPEEPQSYLG